MLVNVYIAWIGTFRENIRPINEFQVDIIRRTNEFQVDIIRPTTNEVQVDLLSY